jgi:ATP-dependent Lon protease
MEQAQREYYLREQLKTIQKELGEGGSLELGELEGQIAAAGMPEEAEKEARKELRRLEQMSEAAAEYGMVRTYLDWMIELPWSALTEDSLDIEAAREILDADHYGLEKVKRRILEFLAVRKLNPDGKSPILCLVGPPGVGKTSLGKSIAQAMGREFVRISLGGVHDESEIRGHRRTYVGAMPGNIVQSLRKAGSRNPVFMLDEMDKLGTGFHGDPSAALLEVLDPAQNSTFKDHYLNVAFDLSKVMFVATANFLGNIPGPLRDRCEVIELTGYTEEEKLEIARRYLVKRQLENTGLKASQCRISKTALREIIRSHTREAGVRNLEREIGAICRHVAVQVAAGDDGKRSIGPADVVEILGAPRFENEAAARTCVPGVATGLAWTPVGGDLLFIEATQMPGKGQLILTGQLGDVMRESAMAALSLIKSRAEGLGIDPEQLAKNDIHVHVPAGSIPKDGPSAGVAMSVALVSLLQGRTVDCHVAMTGEISLRGQVLPVGGIKEKVLAAYNAGIRTVLLPERNRKDLEEIPEAAREKMAFVWLEEVEEALEHALARPGKKARRKASKKKSRKRSGSRTGGRRAARRQG